MGTGKKAERETTGSALIEPDDGVEVQVVSGLIQHQQRWLHEQCPKGVDGV
jgi:ferredoxin-thioredoxin reductase catalytic subunit